MNGPEVTGPFAYHPGGQMHEHSLDTSITGRFKLAIALTALTLAAEVAGGIWTHSLALLCYERTNP